VQLVKRRLVYKFEYTSKLGETIELKTVYDVQFRRYDDSKYTYITIMPDFGPNKKLKIMDCGITWKSLLRASSYCSAHSRGHIDTWFSMDIEGDVKAGTLLRSDAGVIPEQKLSTGQ